MERLIKRSSKSTAIWLMVVLMSSWSVTLFAQNKKLFDHKVYINEAGDSLRYRLLLPKGYKSSKEYPLVLFLHGAGERGSDNEKQLSHGSSLFLDKHNRKEFPAIVVFPQCPEDTYWIDISIRAELRGQGDPDFSQSLDQPSEQLDMVNELVDQLQQDFSVDANRLYVMGLSMGGFGTLETLGRWPDKYAAAVAICGGGNISLAKEYAPNTSVWLTHGGKDDVVPPILSRRVYEALLEENADVRYDLYPEANHNAWDPTFAEPELLPWLFSKHK
ncbi:carboxylesterase family protein [Echinicola pacifica]|nr:prolyl oligopeptidase family serine peptidase [Echinicola pacifica]